MCELCERLKAKRYVQKDYKRFLCIDCFILDPEEFDKRWARKERKERVKNGKIHNLQICQD